MTRLPWSPIEDGVLARMLADHSLADIARSLGRRGIGFDLRPSQCRLTRKRLAGVTPGFAFADGGAL